MIFQNVLPSVKDNKTQKHHAHQKSCHTLPTFDLNYLIHLLSFKQLFINDIINRNYLVTLPFLLCHFLFVGVPYPSHCFQELAKLLCPGNDDITTPIHLQGVSVTAYFHRLSLLRSVSAIGYQLCTWCCESVSKKDCRSIVAQNVLPVLVTWNFFVWVMLWFFII